MLDGELKTDTLLMPVLTSHTKEREKDDKITLQLFFHQRVYDTKVEMGRVQAIAGLQQIARTSGWNYWRRLSKKDSRQA